MKKKSKSKYYVDKEELFNEIKKSYEADEPTKKLHLMLWKMSNNIATRSNFNKYTYKNDFITDAYIKCINVIKNKSFSLEKNNPFAYFTTVINFQIIQFIKKENKQNDIKNKMTNKIKFELETKYNLKHDDTFNKTVE